MRRLVFALVLLGWFTGPAPAAAQHVISARAGYVNYWQGAVTLPSSPDGKVERQIAEGQTVTTWRGRLELLLTPGSFLRLDRNSTVRLLSSRLTDVRVELISGTAMLEVNETWKGTSIVMLWREYAIPIKRTGLYRFEAAQDSLRVYVEKGRMRVPGRKGALKGGRYVELAAAGTASAAVKYNREELDEFDRWNRFRSAELATASHAAVNSFRNRRVSFWSSQWFFHSGFGYYTFLPYRYSIRSPFGYVYRCPGPNYGRRNRNPSYPGRRSSEGGLPTQAGPPAIPRPPATSWSPRPPSFGGRKTIGPSKQRTKGPKEVRRNPSYPRGWSSRGGRTTQAAPPATSRPRATSRTPRPPSFSGRRTIGPSRQRANGP